jgi:hypothetical protein
MDMTKATLNSLSISSTGINNRSYLPTNPWEMKDGYGNNHDLNWLL